MWHVRLIRSFRSPFAIQVYSGKTSGLGGLTVRPGLEEHPPSVFSVPSRGAAGKARSQQVLAGNGFVVPSRILLGTRKMVSIFSSDRATSFPSRDSAGKPLSQQAFCWERSRHLASVFRAGMPLGNSIPSRLLLGNANTFPVLSFRHKRFGEFAL